MNVSRLRFFQKYLYILVHLKGLIKGFKHPHYSQWGEDVVVENILRKVKKGFYVDVGAYHPMHYSNTFRLYKRGWRGINIEPNPSAKLLFSLHRPHDVHVTGGVAVETKTCPYYVFNHQSCTTFSEEQKEHMMQKSYIQLVDTKQIRCEPLRDTIARHASEKHINFLNIDVEGQNFEVLQTLNWDTHAPNVICIEDDDFVIDSDTQHGSKIFSFLHERGYRLVAHVGLSYIYERN